MSNNRQIKLKISLLSLSVILTSIGAISMLVPSLKTEFPHESTALIESIVTLSSLTSFVFVLLNTAIVRFIGKRKTVLTGLTLIIIEGLGPAFVNNFMIILLCRIILGAGLGFINPLAVSLIGDFFKEEKEKAAMLGYQNAVTGLGLTALTFIAGLLAVYNWKYSFMIYLIMIPVFILFYFNVPEVKEEKVMNSQDEKTIRVKPKVSLAVFVLALLIFTYFVFYFTMTLKGASVIVEEGFGTTMDATIILTLRSLATMIGGFFFGKIFRVTKNATLLIGFILVALACYSIFFSNSLYLVGLGMLLGGFSSAIIIPNIYMLVGKYGVKGSENLSVSMIIAGSNLGVFSSPYIINKIPEFFGKDLTMFPFLFAGICFTVLAAGALIFYMFHKKKEAVAL